MEFETNSTKKFQLAQKKVSIFFALWHLVAIKLKSIGAKGNRRNCIVTTKHANKMEALQFGRVLLNSHSALTEK